MKGKLLKLGGCIALGLILVMVVLVACAPPAPEEIIPRSYSCNVYTEQGCAKLVVASGGEIEIRSGGTFDLQDGATVDFSGGVDLDGSTLAFDTDGDTTMVASTDDIITATVNVTDGYLVISVGNLKVGNGSPTTAQDGEDAYVEGGFEVDGTARLDGVATLSNGSAAAPGLAFTSDTDSGLYRIGANNIGVAVSATLISDWTSASMDMNSKRILNIGAAGTDFGADGSLTTANGIVVSAGVVNVPAGSNSAPAYTFASDTDSGLYRVGANNVGMAVSATLISDWTSASMDMNNLPIVNVGAAGTDFGTDGSLTMAQTVTVSSGVVVVPTGSASAPAYTFASDTDSGLYRIGANNVGVAVSATLISDWSSANMDMNNKPIVNVGAAGTDFGTDGALTLAAGLTVNAGGANVTGSIDGSTDIDVGTWLNLSPQSTLAIGADETITPTGTYQVITSTAAITTSTSTAISDGNEPGDVLILRNANAADVIIVDGTGANVECKTDVSLGASDTLTLIWNGTDWNCLSNYDNS